MKLTNPSKLGEFSCRHWQKLTGSRCAYVLGDEQAQEPQEGEKTQDSTRLVRGRIFARLGNPSRTDHCRSNSARTLNRRAMWARVVAVALLACVIAGIGNDQIARFDAGSMFQSEPSLLLSVEDIDIFNIAKNHESFVPLVDIFHVSHFKIMRQHRRSEPFIGEIGSGSRSFVLGKQRFVQRQIKNVAITRLYEISGWRLTRIDNAHLDLPSGSPRLIDSALRYVRGGINVSPQLAFAASSRLRSEAHGGEPQHQSNDADQPFPAPYSEERDLRSVLVTMALLYGASATYLAGRRVGGGIIAGYAIFGLLLGFDPWSLLVPWL